MDKHHVQTMEYDGIPKEQDPQHQGSFKGMQQSSTIINNQDPPGDFLLPTSRCWLQNLIAQGLLLVWATAETCSDDVTELLQVPWGDGSQGMAIGMKALGAL